MCLGVSVYAWHMCLALPLGVIIMCMSEKRKPLKPVNDSVGMGVWGLQQCMIITFFMDYIT